MSARTMRRAVFGGSFDPVHIGHLIIAQAALQAFALDRVIFMPAAASPFKEKSAMISGADRCVFLRAAIRGNANFELSTLELERGGVSYTIDTLLALGASEEAPIYCLIGADIVPGLARWHRADELARIARFIVAGREAGCGASRTDVMSESAGREAGCGASRTDVMSESAGRDGAEEAAPPDFHIEYFDSPRIDVSSTMVRERILRKQSVRYLVPEAVHKLLLARAYYSPHKDPQCE